MSNTNETGCKFCDFGDIELLRNNGYDDDKYVFCEISGTIVEVTDNCPSCTTNHIEEKKQANMNFLIEKMAASLEELQSDKH